MSHPDVPDLSTRLGLLTTMQLLDELQGRFDHSIFHGIKARPTQDKPAALVRMHKWLGDIYMCSALASEMQFICNTSINAVIEDLGEDDI